MSRESVRVCLNMTAFCLRIGSVERMNMSARVCVFARMPVPAWGSGEHHTIEENERVSYEMSHWEDLQVLILAN